MGDESQKRMSETKRPVPRSAEQGYTLVELLVVLAILGLLVAIATPRLIQYLGGAKVESADIQIERLGGVLDLYRLEVGAYPSEQEVTCPLQTQPGLEQLMAD